MDIDVNFVGYVYFTDLINTPKMERLKVPKHILMFESELVRKYCCVGVGLVVI